MHTWKYKLMLCFHLNMHRMLWILIMKVSNSVEKCYIYDNEYVKQAYYLLEFSIF
jgi:hypothetical protein